MDQIVICFKKKNSVLNRKIRHLNKFFTLVPIGLLLFLIISPVLIAQPVERLTIVRGDGFWPPYEWTENSVIKGFHIDFVKAAAKILQLRIQIESYPWKRAIKMVKDGNADAITFITRTKAREQFLYYFQGNQLHLSKAGLLTLKGNKDKINYTGDLNQLRKFTICAQFGHYYGEKFEQASYLDIDFGAKSSEQLIKKLIHGRCELAVGYRYVKEVAQKKGLGTDLINLVPHLSVHPMYLAFSKPRHREKIARQFAEAMTFFKTTSDYQVLIKKYDLTKSRQID